jgi:hypothetical protein
MRRLRHMLVHTMREHQLAEPFGVAILCVIHMKVEVTEHKSSRCNRAFFKERGELLQKPGDSVVIRAGGWWMINHDQTQ